ncbi:LysR family transcriptional regulator [Frankia sp. QA3]|uniref:LysR family transcriptional regulator n=1 Tax=Frankia sp. QA3 TaxID=710111 RepID=UPI000269BED5|nr:LysR family transcriptional regulator [Frankia sp. QA3]EIV92382.1 transcriptional regulator [Frankia sp. QA3]
MDPLETRELRHFLALAEELHFGRAAERLRIAQPALSRTIRRLEQRIGVALVERTTRRVALTPAGEVLAREARVALDAVTAAASRARRAGVGQPRLAVATKADSDAGLLPRLLRAYESAQGRPVDLLLGGWGEQTGMLRDGRADVALLHAPLDATGLEIELLLTEPRVVALCAEHPLARRGNLAVADLAPEPLPRWEGPGGDEISLLWCGHEPEAGRGPRPGHPQPAPAAGPPTPDVAQLLRLVELGRAAAFVPVSIARRYPRPRIAYRAVAGLTPARLVLAWPAGLRSPAVAAFVSIAVDVAAELAADSDVDPDVDAGPWTDAGRVEGAALDQPRSGSRLGVPGREPR